MLGIDWDWNLAITCVYAMSWGAMLVSWAMMRRTVRQQHRLITDLLDDVRSGNDLLAVQHENFEQLYERHLRLTRTLLGPEGAITDEERAQIQHVRICPN